MSGMLEGWHKGKERALMEGNVGRYRGNIPYE